MTATKLDSTVIPNVSEILALHADRLYRELGTSVIAVVELKSVMREQPAADEDKIPAVKLRVITCEIATGPHAEQVRNVQEALYRIRTGAGTFDEIAGLGAQQTVEHAAGVISSTPSSEPDDD